MSEPEKEVENNNNNNTQPSEEIVTPWEVHAGANGIDYDKLINKFGSDPIDQKLLERIDQAINKGRDGPNKRPLHRFLRRGLFFSHRDLNLILDCVEAGLPFYLYTGRGPSSDALHMGHLIPFMFTRWLQEVFNVPLVIMISDDEKFFFKDLSLDQVYELGLKNVKDIIACGFDINKTFIFSDLEYIQYLYPNMCKIQKALTINQVFNCFGFDISDNPGKVMYSSTQMAPSFSSSFPHIFGKGSNNNFPCLIPCAIDQDPYFRLNRDISPRLNSPKPALIHSKFFPGLQGHHSKMSASDKNSAIFVTDSAQEIKSKILTHAFSGGGKTLAEHREKGGNCEIDVPYNYLSFFLESDSELNRIKEEYSKGIMSTSQIKQILIDTITPIVLQHQEMRKKVDDNMVRAFMKVRPLHF